VLLVEGQDMVREHVSNLPAHLGYPIKFADMVSHAMAALDAQPDLDVVLRDVVLPRGASGLDLPAKVRAKRPGMPVAFISGYAGYAGVSRTELEEGVNFLRKPFRRAELSKLLERARAAT
jgi:DNA-binding NtrC family response regulator